MLTATACAAGGANSIDVLNLPSAHELAAIVEREVGTPPPAEPAGIRVDRWPLLDPLPTEVADAPPTGNTYADQLTRRLAEHPSRRPSRAMSCIARELGRFALQHGGPPTAPLREFIIHRCGATVVSVTWTIQTWSAQGPAPTGEAVVKALTFEGTGPVGAWVGGNAQKRVGVAVLGDERLQLEPMPMTVQSGHVELRGRVGPHEWIAGAITQGEYGVAPCRNLAADEGSFHISCPALAQDHGAFIDISMADPGRWLGRRAARIWVSPDGSLPNEYADPAWSQTPVPIGAGEDLVSVSLQTINDLRAQLGAPPLALDQAQTETFDQLRPYYRAAVANGDGKRQDTIALGLFAGWELSRQVVDANFLELRFEAVHDRRHVLEAILLSPSTRLALLDPNVGILAMSIESGSASEAQWGYLGAWVPAPSQAHRPKDEEWLFEQIEVARERSGLPEMRKIVGQPHTILAGAADGVAAGEHGPNRGLRFALDEIVEQQQVPIRGIMYVTKDARTLEVPEQLLRNDVLQMAVHVQQVNVPDTNWARNLVYIAYVYNRDLQANQP